MSNIYLDTLNSVLNAIADTETETIRQTGQRLLAEKIIKSLRDEGLIVARVRNKSYYDIYIQLFNGSNTSDTNGMVRVFPKLDNDIIQNFKLKYLPSVVSSLIDGNTRNWVDFDNTVELIGLIKREMFEVYKYNLEK